MKRPVSLQKILKGPSPDDVEVKAGIRMARSFSGQWNLPVSSGPGIFSHRFL